MEASVCPKNVSGKCKRSSCPCEAPKSILVFIEEQKDKLGFLLWRDPEPETLQTIEVIIGQRVRE